jgi:hypothetical protein
MRRQKKHPIWNIAIERRRSIEHINIMLGDGRDVPFRKYAIERHVAPANIEFIGDKRDIPFGNIAIERCAREHKSMVMTLETSHSETSPLNVAARRAYYLMTEETSHSEILPSNAVATVKLLRSLMTLETS